MASFHQALLICVITLTFVHQGLSCWPDRTPAPRRPVPTTRPTTTTPGASCPNIVWRSGWNARAPRSRTSIRHPVPRVFIHHTLTPSCTSSSACAARMRQMQNFHMDNKSPPWSDIGYNFVVGEDVNVYEGRGWNTVGAHVRGYNSQSIGIAIIGNFTSKKPSSAALSVVKRLISCGVSMGKLSRSYTLHGHRDGDSSRPCPGTALYNEIRTWPHYGGRLP